MRRRYDRQVIIQRKTETLSPSGAPVVTWADIVNPCFAFKQEPSSGGERFASPEKVAEQAATFTIRFHEIPSDKRPLTPKDRIIYPIDGIGANVQEPATGRVFDILSADEVGREVDLSIKTTRRADAS